MFSHCFARLFGSFLPALFCKKGVGVSRIHYSFFVWIFVHSRAKNRVDLARFGRWVP